MKLYHNVCQNKNAKFADDIADNIIVSGFVGIAWLSSEPLLSQGDFIGVAVEAIDQAIERYRQMGDAIEDLGVDVYAIPADLANTFDRERWYVREGEGIEA